MYQTWNTNFFKTLDVKVFDTSSTSSLSIETADNNYFIFDPGPWTSPSRGKISMGTLDLVALLGVNTDFSLYLGSTVLNSSNTLMIEGVDYGSTDIFYLAYNQGGWSGDADFNEPLLAANVPVPEPATILLLTTGLVGLAGLGRRKFKR